MVSTGYENSDQSIHSGCLGTVGFRLCVVQHDNLERDSRVRYETVTGEVLSQGGIGQIEPRLCDSEGFSLRSNRVLCRKVDR